MSDENPSIGIIFCADRVNVEVELALRDVNKPIGVAEYLLQFPESELKELISKEMKENFDKENSMNEFLEERESSDEV